MWIGPDDYRRVQTVDPAGMTCRHPLAGQGYDFAVPLLDGEHVTEETGFDAFFRSDHYAGFFDPRPGLGPSDAWTTLAGLAYLALVVVIVRAITRGTVRRSFPGVSWPSVAILAGPSLASVLSGTGLVVPFSPGILVRTLLASLIVSAITLVVAVARAFESDSPPAWQLGRRRGHATPD